MHLKHLVKEKFVIRKVEDVLNVSYEVNYRKMGSEKSYKESYEKFGKVLERGVENFVPLPVNKQVENVCWAMMMKSLYELKARIDFAVTPDSWEKELLFSLWTDPEKSLPNLEKWLIRLCVEDKKYREEVLEKLTKELEIVKDAVP